MPDVSQVFEASFARAVGDTGYNDRFIQRFYEVFIGKSPEIARMFEHTDMAAQKTMLHDSLHYLLEFYRTGVPNIHLRHIKEVHGEGGANIPKRFFDLWLDSLLQAVKDHDPQFDTDVERAWRSVMAPGIAYMIGERQFNDD